MGEAIPGECGSASRRFLRFSRLSQVHASRKLTPPSGRLWRYGTLLNGELVGLSSVAYYTRSGPYRFVRHPIYCSYLLAAIAGLAASADSVLAPSVIMFFAIYFTAARREERRFALGPLATHYAAYARATGMFLPPPRRWANHPNESRA